VKVGVQKYRAMRGRTLACSILRMKLPTAVWVNPPKGEDNKIVLQTLKREFPLLLARSMAQKS